MTISDSIGHSYIVMIIITILHILIRYCRLSIPCHWISTIQHCISIFFLLFIHFPFFFWLLPQFPLCMLFDLAAISKYCCSDVVSTCIFSFLKDKLTDYLAMSQISFTCSCHYQLTVDARLIFFNITISLTLCVQLITFTH